MRIYWYWPHAHGRTSPLCLSVLRPGDTLTVHALERSSQDCVEPIEAYDVVRELPRPQRAATTRVTRAAHATTLALGRAYRRDRMLRRGFDVAHIGNLTYQTDWVTLRRTCRRVALVCDVHDVRPHAHPLPGAAESWLLRQTYRIGAQFVVLHEVLKSELVGDFGMDPDRVHVVPHVLDSSVQMHGRQNRDSRRRLLFFGTLRANKGLDVLTDAIESLGPDFPAQVVLAGAGDQATTSMLQRLCAHRHVTLELGRVSPTRKHELFAAADWVLLPYTSFHSQSGVLADAYAYRVPLVASDVGALGPTVRADGTGLVVPPRDADALADAMLEAAMTPADAFRPALEAAAQRHDVSVVGPLLRHVYEIAAAG